MNHLKYLLNSKLEKTFKSAPNIVASLPLEWLPVDIRHHVSFAVSNKKALTLYAKNSSSATFLRYSKPEIEKMLHIEPKFAGIFILVKVDTNKSKQSSRTKSPKKLTGVTLSDNAKEAIRSTAKTMQDQDIGNAFSKLADKKPTS